MPKRIQRKRTKGWRMPPDTRYVGRGTIYGNPITVRLGQEIFNLSMREAGENAVDMYRGWFDGTLNRNSWTDKQPPTPEQIAELKGMDLACWCPLDQPCHADVLLDLANKEGT